MPCGIWFWFTEKGTSSNFRTIHSVPINRRMNQTVTNSSQIFISAGVPILLKNKKSFKINRKACESFINLAKPLHNISTIIYFCLHGIL